ncbi:glycosyltransferase family 2 protein [Adlercreutzia sp. ZJ242]|uniref:glycosyltransferase family 2 protein n=1 Tax=Adlercreutzia sp. ZJ242 TaxID=2709409 RepID=UPI00197EFB0F|nr:glycosyltransferase family 2 protein [Adlercreutzia sp. ZJ242]
MKPFFSVIVPLYQCERYVEQCLRSLTDQTFEDFEAIVVDDASPDDSLSVAKRVANGDDRFLFLAMPCNQGQSAARNQALDHAQGDVIVLLDADDYLDPSALEKIASRFQRQKLDDLYFNAEAFYEDAESYKRVVEDFSKRPEYPGVATGMELFTFFESRGQWMPHGALRAVKRSIIEDNHIRFKEGIIHEDLLFTFQTLLLSKRSSYLGEALYRRRIHTGSTMAAPRKSMRNIEGHLIAVNYLRGWMREHASEIEPEFAAAAAHRIEDYLNTCAIDYLNDVPEEERSRFLRDLTPPERVEFELDIAQRAALLSDIYQSRSYRVGHALTAAPRALANALEKATRKHAR